MAGVEDAAAASASPSNPRSPSSSISVAMAAWSSVDKDLLLSVFSKLCISDFIRSAAVCNSWSAAVHEFRSNRLQLRHQSPWLVSFSDIYASAGSVLSLADSTAFSITLPCPPIRERRCIGSSYGWLIVVDRLGDLQLLNPITCKQIDLPSVTTLVCVPLIRNGQPWIIGNPTQFRNRQMVALTFTSEDMELFFKFKASLTTDPSQGDDYTVVVIYVPYSVISFTRPGDRKWTTLPRKRDYDDVAFYKGRLYAVTKYVHRGVDVWDLAAPLSPPTQVVAPETSIEVSPRHSTLDYLVESPSGELLLISSPKHVTEDELKVCWDSLVKVFKVDVEGGRLIQVNSLGDDAIFLGKNSSICLPCANCSELRPNSIYFTDDIIIRDTSDEARYVLVYNLEDVNFSFISFSGRRSRWLSTFWLQPNLY